MSDEVSAPLVGRSGRLVARGDLIDASAGLTLAGLAAWFWVTAAAFEETDRTGFGPASFPKGIAALLAVTALTLLGRGVFGLWAGGSRNMVVINRAIPVLLGIGLVALFPVFLTAIGYFASTAVWLPAFLLVAGYRNPLGIVLCTAGVLAVAKLVFEMLLGIQLG